MTTWITISEAMRATKRSKPTIYRWIAQGRVRAGRRTIDDTLVIDANHLADVEPTITPGRPTGSARPNSGHRASD